MKFFFLAALAVFTLHVSMAQVTATRAELLPADATYLSASAGTIGFSDRSKNTILLRRDANRIAPNPAEPEYFVNVALKADGIPGEVTMLAKGEGGYRPVSDNLNKNRVRDEFPKAATPESPSTVNKNSIFYIKYTFQKMSYGLLNGKAKDIELAENPFGAPDVGFPSGLGGAPHQLTEPVSGNVVIAGDIKYKKDKTKKNSVHNEHRILTFTYDGELVNNLVYGTDEPYRVVKILPIYANYLMAEDGQYDHVAVLLAGSKPKGVPQTDFRKHKVVVIDVKTGAISAESDVDLGIRLPKWIEQFSPVAGTTSHMFIGSYENDPAVGFLTLNKDGVVEVKTYHEGSEEFKLLINNDKAHHEAVSYTRQYHSAASGGGAIYLGKFNVKPDNVDVLGGVSGLDGARKTKEEASAVKELSQNIFAFGPDGKLLRINTIPAKNYKLLSADGGVLNLFSREDNSAVVRSISPAGEITLTKQPDGEFLFLNSGAEFIHNANRKLYVFGQSATDSGLEVITFSY